MYDSDLSRSVTSMPPEPSVVMRTDDSGGHGDSDGDKTYQTIRFMSIVLYSVVFVLGVAGNGVVIWAVGFRMKKTVSTIWYLNLAVTDLLATAYLPLNVAYSALDYHWPFGWFMCKTNGMLFFLNHYSSVFTLAIISVDRCVCVLCPVWTRCSGHRTAQKAFCVVLCVWVLAVVLALSMPYFIFKSTEDRCYDNHGIDALHGSMTPEEYQSHEFQFPAMTVSRFMVGFVVPLSVIASCYAVIVHQLRKRPPTARGGSQSRHRRSFRIIVSVIAAFFLCWLPIHVVWMIYSVNFIRLRDSETLALAIEYGKPVAGALALFNSCVNPLLYVFSQGFNKGVFRRNVVKVLEKAFAEGLDETSRCPGRLRPPTPPQPRTRVPD